MAMPLLRVSGVFGLEPCVVWRAPRRGLWRQKRGKGGERRGLGDLPLDGTLGELGLGSGAVLTPLPTAMRPRKVE